MVCMSAGWGGVSRFDIEVGFDRSKTEDLFPVGFTPFGLSFHPGSGSGAGSATLVQSDIQFTL